MRAKWMGVAVAAVMGCGLGGVQGAEAAIVINHVESLSEGYANNGNLLSVDFDRSGVGSGVFDESQLADSFGDGYYYEYRSDSITYKLTDSHVVWSPFGEEQYLLELFFHDVTVSGSIHDGATPDFSLSYVIFRHPVAEGGSFDDYGAGFGGGPIDGASPVYDGFVKLDVSIVPLPASAPLFAAALLAFGGIGHVSRRNKAKAA